MRTAAIRMGDDLWRLLESEAARLSVSVSQYVREAALARASAAASARGQDPFDLLAEAAQRDGARRDEPAQADSWADSADSRAARARAAARDARDDSRAVRAESAQA